MKIDIVSVKELIRNGIRFPNNLATQSAVSYVLQQQPGRLKAKDIREGAEIIIVLGATHYVVWLNGIVSLKNRLV